MCHFNWQTHLFGYKGGERLFGDSHTCKDFTRPSLVIFQNCEAEDNTAHGGTQATTQYPTLHMSANCFYTYLKLIWFQIWFLTFAKFSANVWNHFRPSTGNHHDLWCCMHQRDCATFPITSSDTSAVIAALAVSSVCKLCYFCGWISVPAATDQ